MYQFLKDYVHKARARHTCIWCGEMIAPGTQYTKRVSTYDGDLQSHSFHMECVEPCQTYCADGHGEFEPYENERGHHATS
jgi:hypothetical protein